jgi:hypothetical protein
MIKGDKIQIHCASTSTEFKRMGVYRFDTDPGILRVFGGKAEVSSAERKVNPGSGRTVNLGSALAASKFSTKNTDALHLWAARRSFFLFTSNPEALRNQTHWEIDASGLSMNRDFQVRLSSPAVTMELFRKQLLQLEDQAKLQQALDTLKVLDEENWRKTKKEIQEQQQRQRQQGQQP